MKVRIILDTISDIGNFVIAVSHATGKEDKDFRQVIAEIERNILRLKEELE